MGAVVRSSSYPFRETADRVKSSIAESGATLFAEINQSAAADSVGLKLRPTILLLFGNPKAGTLLMNAFPLTALELPLRIAIWEEGACVSVAYTPVEDLVMRYGILGLDPATTAMTAALNAIAASISASLGPHDGPPPEKLTARYPNDTATGN